MPARLAPSPSLPLPPTTFVGRREDLAEIGRLLADPSCRLITLIGPGGSGKTRLAIEVAARHWAEFADGVVFIALQAVPTVEDVPAQIAAALGLPLTGGDEPWIQLLQVIRDRRLLVVLDNFEHLIDGAPKLSSLLAAAPAVTFLVTSREGLHLQEEWRYPVAGLPVPDGPGARDAESYDAVKLFVERARRVRLGFSLTAEREGIVQICRLVEGLPLAIELAASWTETLSCAAIAVEIERCLSPLTTRLRNVPERHRSMRAVFDHSWDLLTDEEQATFRQFSVFRGGFQREAGAAVAGATLPLLASLVSKSLLRYEVDGRYHLHQLLQQYAWEHLRAQPAELVAAQARHGAHYLGFLAAQAEPLTHGGQRQAIQAMAGELENIRLAWPYLLEQTHDEALPVAIESLSTFFHLRSRYPEGIAAFTQAVDLLRKVPPSAIADRAFAAAQHGLGLFLIRVGRFAEARAALEEAQARYDRVGGQLSRGMATDPRFGLGVLALIDADFAAAERFGKMVCQRAEAEEHAINLPYGWYVQTHAALGLGDLDAAHSAAHAAYAAASRSRDDWFLAICLNDLGGVALAQGRIADARRHFEDSFSLRQEFADAEGMAVALAHLGQVALAQDEFAEARTLFERSRSIYNEIGDRGGLARVLQGLGRAADGAGNPDEAGEYIAAALRLAGEIHFDTLLLGIAIDAADLLLRLGRDKPAVVALSVARDHPLSDGETRKRADRLLTQAGHSPAVPVLVEVPESAGGRDLDHAVERLVIALGSLGIADSAPQPAPYSATPPPRPRLPDSLTEREMDVLRLIAAGRSNLQIADELFLAVSTVKWYAGQIFGKLGVSNRTQAVARAREIHLLA
jgi:predicted ATPase/DNA-binding NarL/FixJ family response regulator